MMWTVMRREVDRNVRVAECSREAEARSKLGEDRRVHPDEETWIEGDPPPRERRPAPPPIVEDLAGPLAEDTREVATARIVSEHRQPRRQRMPSGSSVLQLIPWRAAVTMSNQSTTANVLGLVILHISLARGQVSSRHPGPLVPMMAIIAISALACAAATLLTVFQIRSARRFLQRAVLIEGVSTRAGIEVMLDDVWHLVARRRRTETEGTPVQLFRRGRKVVQLSRIGAASGHDGEVTWDDVTPGIWWLSLAALIAFVSIASMIILGAV